MNTSDRTVVASHDRRRDPPAQDSPRDSRRADTSARDRHRLEQSAANIKRYQEDVSKRQGKLAKVRLHHEANLASVQYEDDPGPEQDPNDEEIVVYAMGASDIRRFQTSSSHDSSSLIFQWPGLAQLTSATVEKPLGLRPVNAIARTPSPY